MGGLVRSTAVGRLPHCLGYRLQVGRDRWQSEDWRWRKNNDRNLNWTPGWRLRPFRAVGIRELKDNLSRYIRRVEFGDRIAITAHGGVVAELVQPGVKAMARPAASTSSSPPE